MPGVEASPEMVTGSGRTRREPFGAEMHTVPVTGSRNLVNSQGIAVVFISKSTSYPMTTKTHIRVLGLATLAVIMAGFTVPTAFADSDEAAISAPATTATTNIFHYGSDELGFFDPYPGWVDPAYGLGLTPQEEAKMEAELAALGAAYESLFDRFYPEAIPSEEELAEFDARLSALDEEYDAVLARISAAVLEGADAEPLFEMLVTINAKYEQLFEEFYTEITLSEEQQSEFDVRLSALDSVYDGVLEKYGVWSEQSWYIEVGGYWNSPLELPIRVWPGMERRVLELPIRVWPGMERRVLVPSAGPGIEQHGRGWPR